MSTTTLILGAGLGKAYGFPDGRELKELIINELEDHDRELKGILRWETVLTIDAIAKHHPKHATRIRRLVTKLIYEREDEEKLTQNDPPNFYNLMLEQIRSAQEKGDTVKIITFNYDRSLHYLIHRVNEVNQTPHRQLDPNSIHSVYGRLAHLFFEETAGTVRPMLYHQYGAGLTQQSPIYRVRSLDFAYDSEDFDDYQKHFREAESQTEYECRLNELCQASKIHFIGELTAQDCTITKTWLESSDQIFLLGVGYHPENMKVLGFDFATRHSNKVIAGTGFNLSPDTITDLLARYPSIKRIENCDAYEFLRSKFRINELQANRTKLKIAPKAKSSTTVL